MTTTTFSEKLLKVDVVSPEKNLYSDDRVLYVSAPASEGEIGVLPGHMPLVSTLSSGIVEIREKDGRNLKMKINGGFVQVKSNVVLILTEEASQLES
jgi:F-type H+-transporting ATPase subunit epsilon